MTTMVAISDAAKACADQLVLEGRFETLEQAIEAGLHWLQNPWFDEEVDLDDLPLEDREAVEEGLADIAAGRTIPAEQVFAELEARYGKLA